MTFARRGEIIVQYLCIPRKKRTQTFLIFCYIHSPALNLFAQELHKSESLLPWKKKKVGVALLDQVIDCLKIKMLLLQLLLVVVAMTMMRTLLNYRFLNLHLVRGSERILKGGYYYKLFLGNCIYLKEKEFGMYFRVHKRINKICC